MAARDKKTSKSDKNSNSSYGSGKNAGVKKTTKKCNGTREKRKRK